MHLCVCVYICVFFYIQLGVKVSLCQFIIVVGKDACYDFRCGHFIWFCNCKWFGKYHCTYTVGWMNYEILQIKYMDKNQHNHVNYKLLHNLFVTLFSHTKYYQRHSFSINLFVYRLSFLIVCLFVCLCFLVLLCFFSVFFFS